MKVLFILIFWSLNLAVHAQDLVEPLKKFDPKSQMLSFSNRARCALESKKPSSQAFLLVSNVDVGKAIYRLGKLKGENDLSFFTKYGIEKFRYSVLQLTSLIHQRIVNKELPLLPARLDHPKINSDYLNAMKACGEARYCIELDSYLKTLWNSKALQDDYTLSTRVIQKEKTSEMRCAYLEEFGPLEAQVYGTKPKKGALEEIAKRVIDSREATHSCYEFAKQTNLQSAVYKVLIPNTKGKYWNKEGFDYWNSLRVYLSFAFRNAPEFSQMAYPFADIFRGIILEDSLMFISNGCRSLDHPECTGKRLAVNSIRSFAKKNFKRSALDSDILNAIPSGPEVDLIENPIPAVNQDILDFSEHQDASSWLVEFSKNLNDSRVLVKNRLMKGISFLNLLQSRFSGDQLFKDIDREFNRVFTRRARLNTFQKEQLYYLCSEFNFTSHESWSFLRGDLSVLENATILDGVTDKVSSQKISTLFKSFSLLGERIVSACERLKQKSIWDESFQNDRTGFSKWYLEKVYKEEISSTFKEREEKALALTKTPYMSLGADDVLCATPSLCARKAIESVLSLYASTQYAAAFWSTDQKIKSPDLLNPYSERVACKVYDPWYKTKSTILGFLFDVGQAAASAFVPGMIYSKVDLAPKMVTSFKKLVQDGMIEYDARYTQQQIISSVTTDFGALLGAPCSVSINRSSVNPYEYLRFSGITVGACQSNEEYNLNVNTASDVGDNQGSTSSKCLSCALNFETVSTSTLTSAASNVGPVFFLIRGIYRLFKALKDPFNIPRSWKVNPLYAAETHALYGEIPKDCVASLRKGERCLDSCAYEASVKLHSQRDGFIESFDLKEKGWGEIKHSSCQSPIKIKTRSRRQNSSFSHRLPKVCTIKEVVIPDDCSQENI